MNRESSTGDEMMIRQLEEQERQAVLNQDTAALEGIWSEAFVVNNPRNAISMSRGDVYIFSRNVKFYERMHQRAAPRAA